MYKIIGDCRIDAYAVENVTDPNRLILSKLRAAFIQKMEELNCLQITEKEVFHENPWRPEKHFVIKGLIMTPEEFEDARIILNELRRVNFLKYHEQQLFNRLCDIFTKEPDATKATFLTKTPPNDER